MELMWYEWAELKARRGVAVMKRPWLSRRGMVSVAGSVTKEASEGDCLARLLQAEPGWYLERGAGGLLELGGKRGSEDEDEEEEEEAMEPFGDVERDEELEGVV